ncbi:putative acetyltransferase, partial [Vibrio parahaemolyticus VPTS-2009]
DGQFGWA